MGKTNLLNTHTTTYRDLVGNGRIFRVPPYQRDYSWQEEQWEDLWEDILALANTPSDSHYMGALVVEGVNDREFLIIDGQQRLATLSIFALSVVKRLSLSATTPPEADDNIQRAEVLRTMFIGAKDPASLIESSKLFLNQNDDAFYQDYLVQLRTPTNPRGLVKSNKLMWECFQYFSSKIEQYCYSSDAEGERLASLLASTAGGQLMFILITVDDELNAYTVFETLNARGLELSSTDLLKNYLFSRLKVSTELQALQRRWRSLISTVRQENFPEFLRYHMLCEYPKIRSQRLYKLVRDQVKTPEQVFYLIKALEERAELFAAMSDPDHGYWIENPACRDTVRELKLFRVRQMMPLLFSAWESMTKENFAAVLKIVSVVSFRYTVVCGRNTNKLEPVYHEAAKNVAGGGAKTPADVFKILKAIYVDDDEFEQIFSRFAVDTSGQRKTVAKYILLKLESNLSGILSSFDTNSGTIEHILPENPTSDWEDNFPQDKWESNVYRIGKLTLLEPSINREIGNSVFQEKLPFFEKSAYRLTLEIVENSSGYWTPALLDQRQNQLARRASQLWRCGFV